MIFKLMLWVSFFGLLIDGFAATEQAKYCKSSHVPRCLHWSWVDFRL